MKKIVSASLAMSYLIATSVILIIAMISIFGLIQENTTQQSQDTTTASIVEL